MAEIHLDDRLEEFVKYFVKFSETKLHLCHLIFEGEVKKAGKLSDTFSGPVGQTIVGGLLALLLYPFGFAAAGAKAGGEVGKMAGEKLGNYVGNKSNEEKTTKLNDLLDEFLKDKSNFRRKLAEAAFDIFQSFEMQFLRATTEQGKKKAIQLLAQDASNRVINHIRQYKGPLQGECVLLGESKSDSIIKKLMLKVGFPIFYEYETSKQEWYTAKLYEKAGLVVEGNTSEEGTGNQYYDKKHKGHSSKYGYRRLFSSESRTQVTDKYEVSDTPTKAEFRNYQYILSSRDSERKIKPILDKINQDDEDLMEDRIEQIIKDVKSEFMDDVKGLLPLASNTEDRKILKKIEDNLKNINKDKYLEQIKHYFEKITKTIQAGQEDNKENFQQLRQNQDIHHADLKEEINKIGRIVKAQKIDQKVESISFDVRDPVPSFTGRHAKLEAVDDVLKTEEGHLCKPRTVAITGLGGVGKSEFACKYAYDHRQYYDNHVMWINAETKEHLKTSFRQLAESLGIPIKAPNGNNEDLHHVDDRDTRSIVKDVYNYFNDAKSLFVFDNVDEYKDISDLLPSSVEYHEKPYILITSRNQEWEVGVERRIKVLRLDEFTEEEAVEFIKKCLRITAEDNSNDAIIKELAEKLQYLPLALRQATSYITEKSEKRSTIGIGKYEVTDYLTEYEKEEKQTLLSFKSKYDSDPHIKTVFTTWKVTLKNIKTKGESGRQALELLRVMAYFSPHNISVQTYFSKYIQHEEELEAALELLIKYSMINVKNGVARIHRLVQDVIRLANQKNEEDVLRTALHLIKHSDDATQIVSIWKYACNYSSLISDFESVYGVTESTPLHLLADSGDVKAIEAILQHKMIPSQACSDEKRILEYVFQDEISRDEDLRPKVLKLEEILKDTISSNTQAHNIERTDIYGRTPLYRAAENGHVKVVELLVKNGANIEADSASAPLGGAIKWTPLHIAAYAGHKDVVELLMVKGAKPDVKDSKNITPLYIAINGAHEEVAKLLDRNGEKTLAIAASLGKLGLAEDILKNKSEKEKKIMCNPAQHGMPGPLHFVARTGHLDVAKLLVENGADIICFDTDSFTPLHIAAAEGHLDIVEFLVQKIKQYDDKFDILKCSDKTGYTVLHSAALGGHIHILEFLFDEFSQGGNESLRSALVDATDAESTTLLHIAASNGKLNCVQFLINSNANLNAANLMGCTPLFFAAFNNEFAVVEFLLKQKRTRIYCDLEKFVGLLDITPLHAAALYDNLDMARLLVSRSRVNAGLRSSLTPLHVAAIFNSSKVINYLVDNGASPDAGVNLSNFFYASAGMKDIADEGEGLQLLTKVIPIFSFLERIGLLRKLSPHITPRMISTLFGYDNQLTLRDANRQVVDTGRVMMNKFLSIVPSFKNFLKFVVDYVESKKSCRPAPPSSEDSVLGNLNTILTRVIEGFWYSNANEIDFD